MNHVYEVINEFMNNNIWLRILVDGYLTLLLLSFVLFVCFKYRKAFNLLVLGIIINLVYFFLIDKLELRISHDLYYPFVTGYLIICVVLLAPELRKLLEFTRKNDTKSDMIVSSTQATKEAIVDAVFHMSSMKVGALITIEQHNSLDQYAEKAIQLNSDISRELLEQIFIKDSPLHDGGVIIRGNRIVCAGAYYVLTQDESLDKTIGSRHRAAVGISEITDSLTIVVSEETGAIHVANAGFMKNMDNKNELLEYLNLFLGR